jgi:hypothetical protein
VSRQGMPGEPHGPEGMPGPVRNASWPALPERQALPWICAGSPTKRGCDGSGICRRLGTVSGRQSHYSSMGGHSARCVAGTPARSREGSAISTWSAAKRCRASHGGESPERGPSLAGSGRLSGPSQHGSGRLRYVAGIADTPGGRPSWPRWRFTGTCISLPGRSV